VTFDLRDSPGDLFEESIVEKKRRKLHLAKETLGTLSNPQMFAARGGTEVDDDANAITIITVSCQITCQRSCGGTCENTCQYSCTGSAVICCA
jgi:hypothetical protein